MPLSVLNDLVKAMKALDGKKDLADRSHGSGCTAASYTGATQWHSLWTVRGAREQ